MNSLARIAVLLTAFLLLSGNALPQPPPLRIKPGDVLTVTVIGHLAYSGDYTVLSDGSISGRGFEGLVVRGATIAQSQAMLTRALAKIIRDPAVFVTLKAERPLVVYVVGSMPAAPQASGGAAPTGSAIPIVPGMDLRQLLGLTTLADDPDNLTLSLYRKGDPPKSIDLLEVLSGGEAGNLELKAEDVYTFLPKPYVRVWVTGAVAKPGQYRLQAPGDAYKAIALAGGLGAGAGSSAQATADDDFKVLVRRGPATMAFPFKEDPSQPQFKLESGDTVIVSAKAALRLTIAGEVEKPGDYVMRGWGNINTAIGLAGGMRAMGTLQNVTVLRKGEVFQINASAVPDGGTPMPFALEDGDFVYVRKNEATVVVLGEVKNPGRLLLPDNKTYRATEALALVGGLADKGTLRRVYLARPGWDGRLEIKQFNLDEYLKDGKVEANPLLQAGDILLFGQPKGITIANLSQVLSNLILAESLFRR